MDIMVPGSNILVHDLVSGMSVFPKVIIEISIMITID